MINDFMIDDLRRTQEVWVLEILDKGETNDDGGAGHAGHGKKGNHGKLCLLPHVELGYQEDGQDGAGEIGDDTEDTVQICEGDDDVGADAFSVLVRVPEIRDGPALEEGDKEKDDSGAECDGHCGVKDPDVHLSVGDSKEGNADGYL
jgi:hypothetical protein